jgi:hypothetical protein
MDERESYSVKMEDKLRKLGEQIDEMMWKTKNFTRDARKSFKQSANKLRRSKKDVSKKLGEIKSASGKSWKDLTQGFERGMNELEKGFETAVRDFKKTETASEKEPSK